MDAARWISHQAGATWIAHPDELMQRASHLLDVDGGTWIIDPLDVDDLEEHLRERSTVAGVVVTMARHARDAALVAERLDVPVHVPVGTTLPASGARVHVYDVEAGIDGLGCQVLSIIDVPVLREHALWHEGSDTLIVGDALGSTSYFTEEGQSLGVHPLLRMTPPRELGELDAQRVLVGHGAPVLTDASDAVDTAVARARTGVVGTARHAFRSWRGSRS